MKLKVITKKMNYISDKVLFVKIDLRYSNWMGKLLYTDYSP